MFCGLGEEERTKIRKKKGKKRKKKVAKSGLVGMKGYLETYNPMQYFLPYLEGNLIGRPYREVRSGILELELDGAFSNKTEL